MTADDSFKNIPVALSSDIRTRTVNEPVVLYQGKAIIEEPAGQAERDVIVLHEWTPNPKIVCRYETPNDNPFIGNALLSRESILVEIPDLGVSASARYHDGFSSGNIRRHGLRFVTPIEKVGNGKMTRMLFHVVNLRDFSEEFVRHPDDSAGGGRIRLSTDEWNVTIDKTQEHDSLADCLDHTGGRALTHRIQFERRDKKGFEKESVNEIVSLVESFIAFVTGSWATLTLPIAYDEEGECCFLQWHARRVRRWLKPYTWSMNLPSDCVKKVFHGFAARFKDEDWNEPLTQAVRWYVQCRNESTESSIILCQAALELLAWVIYVENGSVILGTNGFENLWASDRIRLLLKEMRVNYDIPPRLQQLKSFKFNGSNLFSDGPHAITDIRNGITHPKKKKRERLETLGPQLRYETSELGLFYLECSLLGLCGYFGSFRADPVYGALYCRDPHEQEVYKTADFSKLFPFATDASADDDSSKSENEQEEE